MSEHFGVALRTLRRRAGLSLADVAGQTMYSKTTIANVEKGKSRPTIELARSLDQLFGCSPLLAMYRNGGDDVRRRAMLGLATVALGAGVLGARAASGGLAAVVRLGLELDRNGNLDETVAAHRRAYLINRGPTFGDALLADLQVIRQQIREAPHPDLLRAGAELALLYGLYTGDTLGDTVAAHGWYTSAIGMAEDCDDKATAASVRGRATARGVYEGLSVSEARAAIRRTLALRPDGEGAMEGRAAEVHLAGVMGDLAAGRVAAERMAEVAARLAEPEHAATPTARAALFTSYLECRLGSMADADAAYARAWGLLRDVPPWAHDAKIYYGMALVRDGQPDAGIRYALAALVSEPTDSRIHALGVRDLIGFVPEGFRSEELDELARYSSREHGPWETLRP